MIGSGVYMSWQELAGVDRSSRRMNSGVEEEIAGAK